MAASTVDLQSDLREFLELLLSKKVDFLIVGAHAVAFYGHPRLTGDIDLLIRLSEENAERIVEVCNAFGFSGPPFVTAEFLVKDQTFQLGRAPNRIDILTGISGVDTEEAWTRRVHGKLADLDVMYIAKADLIANKRATGRARDLADVEVLLRRGD